MPCYDIRNSREYIVDEARIEYRHDSDVAELLCDLMKQIADGKITYLSPELLTWWDEHQRRDALKDGIK